MHTAPILRIAVDSSQTYLITGLDNRTVRVWELKTGNLLKVLRVPVDEGNEGRIDAVALFPNGKHLAEVRKGKTLLFFSRVYYADKKIYIKNL